jgi:hypothetical protein
MSLHKAEQSRGITAKLRIRHLERNSYAIYSDRKIGKLFMMEAKKEKTVKRLR